MDWVGIIISTVIGIPVGVLCSLAAWGILFYVIVPKITFSPFISKINTKEAKSSFEYRIAFQNTGKRGVVDAEIYAKLRIYGLKPDFPRNSEFYSIPLEFDKIPKIIPQKDGSKHIIRLDVAKIDELTSRIVPHQGILSNFEENSNLLEDLLSLGTKAYLQIYVFGYDAVSGTRKVFESKQYRLNDVLHGRFSGTSLNVVAYNSNKDLTGTTTTIRE